MAFVVIASLASASTSTAASMQGSLSLALAFAGLHVNQQKLGHSSLATTDRCCRRLNLWQVVEVMRGREWGK
jgi:hypothetical protein